MDQLKVLMYIVMWIQVRLILNSISKPLYLLILIISESTIINHDKDATQTITQCSTKDCYQLGLNYKNSMEQVKAIIGVSETCQQKIEVMNL